MPFWILTNRQTDRQNRMLYTCMPRGKKKEKKRLSAIKTELVNVAIYIQELPCVGLWF